MIQETRHSIRDILARQPLFRSLNEHELGPIAAGTREYRLRRNEVLFQKGDMPEGMHIMIMGQAKLFIPATNGAEKVVHMIGPGHTFGEAVVFLEKPYPVSAIATQDSIVILVTKNALETALNSSPMLSRKMLASLSMRLHDLLADMETCTLRTSMQRVVCYLAQQIPADKAVDFTIQLGSSKQTIASQLNLAPETLSRVLSQLSEAGLIQVNGRAITVASRDKLLQFQA
jgi:CRP-like cAMP-binding protein